MKKEAGIAELKADEANTIKIELTAQEEEIVAKLSRRHFGWEYCNLTSNGKP